MNYILGIVVIIIVTVVGISIVRNQNNPSQSFSPFPTPTPTITPTPTPPGYQLLNPPVNPPQSGILNATPTQAPSSMQIPSKPTQAAIRTSKGNIVIAFYSDDAPSTVENFAKKAVSGFYKNLTFHRVEDWVIQGGDPKGDGTGGGVMPTEINKKPFVAGSLGVARESDVRISNDAQFFITKTDAAWLNGQYTNFGIVTDGMDVVQKIEIGDKILEIAVQ